MENLRPGGLVVGVVQSHEAVPDERGKLSASYLKLRVRGRRLECFRQISLDLKFGVTAAVNCRRPFDFFATGEDLLREFKSVEVFGEWHQTVANGCTMLHLLQTIAKSKQRDQRDKPLIVQHGAHATGQLRMHAPTVSGALRWP